MEKNKNSQSGAGFIGSFMRQLIAGLDEEQVPQKPKNSTGKKTEQSRDGKSPKHEAAENVKDSEGIEPHNAEKPLEVKKEEKAVTSTEPEILAKSTEDLNEIPSSAEKKSEEESIKSLETKISSEDDPSQQTAASNKHVTHPQVGPKESEVESLRSHSPRVQVSLDEQYGRDELENLAPQGQSLLKNPHSIGKKENRRNTMASSSFTVEAALRVKEPSRPDPPSSEAIREEKPHVSDPKKPKDQSEWSSQIQDLSPEGNKNEFREMSKEERESNLKVRTSETVPTNTPSNITDDEAPKKRKKKKKNKRKSERNLEQKSKKRKSKKRHKSHTNDESRHKESRSGNGSKKTQEETGPKVVNQPDRSEEKPKSRKKRSRHKKSRSGSGHENRHVQEAEGMAQKVEAKSKPDPPDKSRRAGFNLDGHREAKRMHRGSTKEKNLKHIGDFMALLEPSSQEEKIEQKGGNETASKALDEPTLPIYIEESAEAPLRWTTQEPETGEKRPKDESATSKGENSSIGRAKVSSHASSSDRTEMDTSKHDPLERSTRTISSGSYSQLLDLTAKFKSGDPNAKWDDQRSKSKKRGLTDELKCSSSAGTRREKSSQITVQKSIATVSENRTEMDTSKHDPLERSTRTISSGSYSQLLDLTARFKSGDPNAKWDHQRSKSKKRGLTDELKSSSSAGTRREKSSQITVQKSIATVSENRTEMDTSKHDPLERSTRTISSGSYSQLLDLTARFKSGDPNAKWDDQRSKSKKRGLTDKSEAVGSGEKHLRAPANESSNAASGFREKKGKKSVAHQPSSRADSMSYDYNAFAVVASERTGKSAGKGSDTTRTKRRNTTSNDGFDGLNRKYVISDGDLPIKRRNRRPKKGTPQKSGKRQGF